MYTYPCIYGVRRRRSATHDDVGECREGSLHLGDCQAGDLNPPPTSLPHLIQKPRTKHHIIWIGDWPPRAASHWGNWPGPVGQASPSSLLKRVSDAYMRPGETSMLMKSYSVHSRFSQHFEFPAEEAYMWCT